LNSFRLPEIFSYNNGDLVFAPQLTWNIHGVAKFVQRALIVKLYTCQRIDFRYFGANEITMEDGAFIFSMHEPPQFSEEIVEDPMVALMAKLGIAGRAQPTQKRNGPERHRCSSFDEAHKELVGSCLVYRIGLKRSNMSSDHYLKQNLQQALPQIVNRRTEIFSWPEPFAIGLKRLQQSLASFGIGLPFPVVFQIQKLVQNAYLAPNVVADLISTIRDIMDRSGQAVCVAALKKLFPTINYLSLDVDPEEYQLESLIKRLEEKEKVCKREGLLLEEAHMSGNVALIHRAKITPTSGK